MHKIIVQKHAILHKVHIYALFSTYTCIYMHVFMYIYVYMYIGLYIENAYFQAFSLAGNNSPPNNSPPLGEPQTL